MDVLENLLSCVAKINNKYEEAAKKAGENFNIFEILGLASNELIHSKLIATLLDPNGCHGKQDVFLKYFLDVIGEHNFESKDASIEVEKSIGPIDPAYENGGRIDIVINGSKPNPKIFIENKIYAIDQKNQLVRYHNHNTEAILVYLTLDGKEASNLNGKEKIEYKKISYRDHIVKWLEKCINEAENPPILQETISQYIILIRHLTGDTRSSKMSNEIIAAIVKDPQNIAPAFEIANILPELKKHIFKENLEPSLKQIGEKYKLEFEINYDQFPVKWWNFSFKKRTWKYVCICFYFGEYGLNHFAYGLQYLDDKLTEEILKQLRTLGGKNSEWFPYYKDMDKYGNWDKDIFTLIAANQQNDLINTIELKIEELLDIIKKYDL
jgi:hypothetical protein